MNPPEILVPTPSYDWHSPAERTRIESLLRLLPNGASALEIGARAGRVTQLLAQRFQEVVALDLEKPDIDLQGVTCISGDLRDLPLNRDQFDVVICTEVLEHIPPADLVRACRELGRVARHYVLIGVPFDQDLRVARTRCAHCGAINPPYGHVNRFDESRLRTLLTPLRDVAVDRVGQTREATNGVSDFLMRLAGYPWGTYDQDEPCVQCGERIESPTQRSGLTRVLSGAATRLDLAVNRFRQPRPKWLHMVFAKDP